MEYILEVKAIGQYQFPPLAYLGVFGNHKDVKLRGANFSPQFSIRQLLSNALYPEISLMPQDKKYVYQ